MNRTIKRIAVPVGAALILGSSGFAFMASNSVPVTSAGNGSAAIAGYEVSDVTYQLVDDAFSPFLASQESIQRVSFTLNKPANTVRAYIDDATAGNDQRQFLCSPVAGVNRWQCTPANAGFGVLTADASALHVVAAQ